MALGFRRTDGIVPVVVFELLNDFKREFNFSTAVIAFKRDAEVEKLFKEVHGEASFLSG
jgi:hypothetical protein